MCSWRELVSVQIKLVEMRKWNKLTVEWIGNRGYEGIFDCAHSNEGKWNFSFQFFNQKANKKKKKKMKNCAVDNKFARMCHPMGIITTIENANLLQFNCNCNRTTDYYYLSLGTIYFRVLLLFHNLSTCKNKNQKKKEWEKQR